MLLYWIIAYTPEEQKEKNVLAPSYSTLPGVELAE